LIIDYFSLILKLTTQNVHYTERKFDIYPHVAVGEKKNNALIAETLYLLKQYIKKNYDYIITSTSKPSYNWFIINILLITVNLSCLINKYH